MRPLLSIFVVGICVGAYFMYIKPMSVEVRVLNAKKEEYNNVLNTVQEIKEKRDAVLLDYNSLSEEEIYKLNKIIPDTLNSVLYLNDVSALAIKNGLIVKEYRVTDSNNGITPQTEGFVPTNSFKITKVSMKVTGGYAQFLNFLNEIESSLSLTDVTNLRIEKGSTGTSGTGTTGSTQTSTAAVGSVLDYTFEARVYSLK